MSTDDKPQITITIDEERLRAIIHDEFRDGMKMFGVDPDDTLENQKDMAWLRTWRIAVTRAGSSAGLTILGVLVTGTLGLIATVMGIPQRFFG